MRDEFTEYLDSYNHPLAPTIKAFWADLKVAYPSLPLPYCGPSEEGKAIQLVLDTDTRVLQLDLSEAGGELFWKDRETHDYGGDDEPHSGWKEAFMDRIPWLLKGDVK